MTKSLKRIVLVMALLMIVPLSSADASQKEQMVYICTGPQSKCYHKTPGCRGLERCSKDIIKVTRKEAEKKYGRRACKWCYE